MKRGFPARYPERKAPALQAFLVAVAVLVLEVGQAGAAYRLTFKNGTSVEVPSYEDLGDAIRYPRFGGTVTVPKANVSAIEEAIHLPAPEMPTPSRPAPTFPPPLSTPPTRQAPQPAPTTQRRAATPNPADQFSTDIARVVARAMTPLIFLILGAGGLLVLVRLFLSRIGTRDTELPYRRADSLLTPAERSFYGALSQVIEDRFRVFAKVRLSDLLEVPWGTPRAMAHRNKINQKHVDFVLCDANSFTPLLVIELDDSSHDREARQNRDAFVDAALQAAGVPILHVSAQYAYARADLRVQIYGHLKD